MDLLQQLHVLLMLGVPELDTVLQVGSHESAVENPPPRPAGHNSLDAAQDTVGFLGCKHTLLAYSQFSIDYYPPVLFLRAGLNPLITQSVFVHGIASTHLQDFALGPVELLEVCMGPPLKGVQVPLDGITSLQ